MTRPFRYVDETSEACVTLHLFRIMNGTPCGDVRGPVSPYLAGRSNIFDMQSCLPVSVAFAAAIRMANRSDVELVISGDKVLWDVAWGVLAGPLPVVVLVVEDEALVRISIVGFMEHDGFEVLTAGSALEAIAILASNSSIRMMFTDVDMPPGMVCRGQAAAVRDQWPLVRIIVTSGRCAVAVNDMPPGSTFFSKPYRHDAVMASIRSTIPIRLSS